MSAIKRKIEDDMFRYGISREVLETMRQWHEIDKRLAVQEEWHRNFSKALQQEIEETSKEIEFLKNMEIPNG